MNTKTKICAVLLAACVTYNLNAMEKFIRPSVFYTKPSTEGYSGEMGVGAFGGVLLGDHAQHELSLDFNYTTWEYREAGGFADEKKLPLLGNYRYHIQGTDNLSNVRIYVGPCAGWTMNDVSLRVSPTLGGSNKSWSFSWGGSVGFLVKIYKNIDLDVGYRTLTTGGTAYTFHDRQDNSVFVHLRVDKTRADVFYCAVGIGF